MRCSKDNICRLGYVNENIVNCTSQSDCQDVWIVERPEYATQKGIFHSKMIFGELQNISYLDGKIYVKISTLSSNTFR